MLKKGEASWIRWIKKRIRNNLNFLAVFTGPTGSGKSFSAMEMARTIDPEFNPELQVAFNFSQLMKIINKFNNKDASGLYDKKFKICIFDEVQTDANRREWQSKTNKFLNYVLSTFRHQNIICFFTTPYEDYIDSAALKLFHAKFECRGWSKKTKKSTLRPKIFQYNAQRRKMYEHSLHVITPTGVKKMITWDLNCPPKEMIIPYEKVKFEFTNALNMRITRELEAIEEADKPKGDEPKLNPRQEEIEEDIKVNGYKTQKELAIRHKMTPQHLGQHFKWAKNKGHDWTIFKDLEN